MGAFVLAPDAEVLLPVVESMISHDVPVWICWAYKPRDGHLWPIEIDSRFVRELAHGRLSVYAPSAAAEEALRTAPIGVVIKIDGQIRPIRPPLPRIVGMAPPGVMPSRENRADVHIPGQTPIEFFAWRAEVAESNPALRLVYKERQANQRLAHCPGVNSLTPCWEWYEDYSGKWHRVLIPLGERNSRWLEYGPNQRVYNVVWQCWDLCKAISVEEVSDETAFNNYDGPTTLDSMPKDELVAVPEPVQMPDMLADVHTAFDALFLEQEEYSPPTWALLNNSVANYLMDKFGLMLGLEPYNKSLFAGLPTPCREPNPADRWRRLKSILGFCEIDDNTAAEEVQQCMDFVAYLAAAAMHPPLLPPSMWDLHPDHYISGGHAFSKLAFCVEILHTHLSERDAADRRLPQVWYLIHPLDPLNPVVNAGWVLALTDPMMVIYILRHPEPWGGNMIKIVCSLLEIGAQFHTLWTVSLPLPQPLVEEMERYEARTRRPPSPAVRPKGTYITRKDYLFAESTWRNTMQTSSLGRKCLMQGGPLARLAYQDGVDHCVVFEDLPIVVNLELIDSSLLIFGTVAYIDDFLNDRDVKIATGVSWVWASPENARRPQYLQLSFWPTPWHWASSGSDYGEWMPRNKDWFCAVNKRSSDAARGCKEISSAHFTGALDRNAWKSTLR